jgi:signal transduction histidine kinase
MDTIKSKDDLWAIERWKLRNEELEKLLQEKTNELDCKNRELEIEAALERVRTKAMAMHKSKDISEATAVVFNELTYLGVEMERCGIVIFNKTPVIEVWSTPLSPNNKQVIEVISGNLDTSIHPLLQGIYKTWTEKKDFYTYELEGEEVKKYYDLLEKAPEYHFPKIARYKKYQVIQVFYFMEGGLFVYTKSKVSEEVKQIFQRFTNVFSLTYRRYLDIVKAEAQAREAQIEAALERIRSRSLAMHNSSELRDVIAVTFEKLTDLNVLPGTVGIQISDRKSMSIKTWVGTPIQEIQLVEMPYDEHIMLEDTFVKDGWQAITEGVDIINKVYSTQQKNKYFEYLFSHNSLAQIPEEARTFLRKMQSHVVCLFVEKNSAFLVDSFDGKLFPQENITVIKRAAKVFEQAYVRFLDLQKAEAQAREAQIEAALERVRTKAMAMHSSKDISDATAIVFNELTRLGIEMERCGIALINDIPVAELWSTLLSPKNNEVVNVITGHLDFRMHPMGLQFHKHWGERKNFSSYKLVGDDVRNYYDKLEKQPGYQFPKISSYPDQQFGNIFFFKQGGIFAFTNDELSAEANNIFQRFAKVFEQTYTRFLDLQKAEAQTREAQIEAALERVRGKAMAMHNSEDLNATIGAFYRELEQFSITPRRCGVGLLQKNRLAELSTMNTMEQGNSIVIIGKLKMEGHWVLDGVYDNWILQKEFHPVLRGNEIKEYNQILRPQIDFPEYPNSTVQYGYFFFFPEGGVYAWTEKEMKEDELIIYRKFTTVLSLTYKRYKDLKDAEANAREAVRRASLDRVRAEIASMRTADDLQQITPTIWHELSVLSVPFVRCGVFIMNEEKEHIQAYLSTPDGHSIAALKLSYHSSNLAMNSVEHWRQGIIFKTHWDRQEFLNWMKSMIEQGQVSNQEIYQGAAQPPETLHLHFIPFKQGMLYVGNTSPLNKEALELVKALAESFSIAYARFEDFRQLEAAKDQTEKTLAELKATQAQLIQSEKMASLGELTAGIAHEIQNPLNFVNNFSEVSEELVNELKEVLINGDLEEAKEISSDVIENLQKIKHHGLRASNIVKGMLQHSRSSNGKKEPTDINALADEYLRLSYHGLLAKDKTFTAEYKTHFDPALPKINVIPQDIGRVLLNMINNAFYAVQQSPQKQREYKPMVVVSTKNTGTHVEIRVKDNGPGIPSEIRDKIFQPFFTTKPTGVGTGLGLSLSYDIVKAHGGKLKVETLEGEGTEFIVQLPV